MLEYTNSYLRLSIAIPFGWRVISWRHTKLDASRHREFQFQDDDLPAKVGRCKVLFNASLYTPGSDVELNAEIEPAVYRLRPGDELRTSLLENHERLIPMYDSYGMKSAVTGEGSWTTGGVTFGFVDEELISRSGHSRYRFLYRRIEEALWFCAKIAGHKEWAFTEAVKVVQELNWQGSDGEPGAATDRPRD
jgi:hypothetical protein